MGRSCVQEVLQDALQHVQRAQLLESLKRHHAEALLARDPAAFEALRRIMSAAGSSVPSASEPELRAPSHVIIEELPPTAPVFVQSMRAEPAGNLAATFVGSAGGNRAGSPVAGSLPMPLYGNSVAPGQPPLLGKRKVQWDAAYADGHPASHVKRLRQDAQTAVSSDMATTDPMDLED